MSKPIFMGLGILGVLVGMIWLGQGLNYFPGTAMSGSPLWAIVGAIVLIAGIVLMYLGRRPSFRDPNGPPGQH